MNQLHFAVVVGINQYPGYSAGNLNHPRGDAERFRDWLIDPNGGALPPGNVRVVTRPETDFSSGAPIEPTREHIEEALLQIYSDVEAAVTTAPAAWDKTRLYLFLSGHGLAPGPEDVAVLMANATDGALGRNIGCAQYLNYYKDHQPFKEVVLFADCCRTLRAGVFAFPPSFTRETRQRGDVSTVLGYASEYQTPAFEPSAGGGGSYFTEALLEGLHGSAADPVTGQINIISLKNYVEARVDSLSGGAQLPDIGISGSGTIVFAAGSKRPDHKVLIRLPEGFNGRVELQDGGFRSVAQHDAADGPWTLELPEGLYRVIPVGGDGDRLAEGGVIVLQGDDNEFQL